MFYFFFLDSPLICFEKNHDAAAIFFVEKRANVSFPP